MLHITQERMIADVVPSDEAEFIPKTNSIYNQLKYVFDICDQCTIVDYKLGVCIVVTWIKVGYVCLLLLPRMITYFHFLVGGT